MTKYSGETTAYAHKRLAIEHMQSGTQIPIDWTQHPVDIPSVKQVTVFDAQWSDCPVEVEEEVRKLWRTMELGNDNCYFSWKRNEEHEIEIDGEDICQPIHAFYPLIDEYLISNGVSECLIHWWW